MESETKKILQKYGLSSSYRRFSSIPSRPQSSAATVQKQPEYVQETIKPKSEKDLILDRKRLSLASTMENFSERIALRKTLKNCFLKFFPIPFFQF